MVDDKDLQPDEEGLNKSAVYRIGDMRILGLSEDDAKFYQDFSPKERNKLIRKVCNGLDVSMPPHS